MNGEKLFFHIILANFNLNFKQKSSLFKKNILSIQLFITKSDT
jgi:hypothetical protein